MARFPCPVCGDPNAYPFWFGEEPPAGCPQDDAWQTERGVSAIRNVTECSYQMRKAFQAREFRRLVPDAFDADGRIKDDPGTLARVLEAFHKEHPNWLITI